MVYSHRFIMSVLFNGNILQDRKDGIVPIPLIDGGTEYGLRFRNRHNKRAVVKFSIDGEESSGNGYIIGANSHIDIFRYNHRDAKFKFVTLTSNEAADFGKSDNLDGGKGVIEARFYLEKNRPQIKYVPYPVYQPYPHYQPFWYDNAPTATCRYDNGILRSMAGGSFSTCSFNATDQNMAANNVSPLTNTTPLTEGCTVEGGASGQNFSSAWIDLESDYTALKLVLRGTNSEIFVNTAQETSHCTQCGTKRSRKSDKFCGSCGNKF